MVLEAEAVLHPFVAPCGTWEAELMLRDWPAEWPLERIAALAQTSFVAHVASEPVRLALFSGF